MKSFLNKPAILITLLSFLSSSCAGSGFSYGPAVSAQNALTNSASRTPEVLDDDSTNLEEKSGALIIGIVAVGVAVGTAIIVPLALNDKF